MIRNSGSERNQPGGSCCSKTVEQRRHLERVLCAPLYRCAAARVKTSLRITIFSWRTPSHSGITNQAHALPRISSSAFLLLVWHLTTQALHLPASSTAHFTILCDTVFVNNTIRSGLPICLLKEADICVNTFALQLNRLQICLY